MNKDLKSELEFNLMWNGLLKIAISKNTPTAIMLLDYLIEMDYMLNHLGFSVDKYVELLKLYQQNNDELINMVVDDEIIRKLFTTTKPNNLSVVGGCVLNNELITFSKAMSLFTENENLVNELIEKYKITVTPNPNPMTEIEILKKQNEIMEEALQAIVAEEEEPVQLALRAISSAGNVGV